MRSRPLAGELPDHGPELLVGMEGQAVVNHPEPAGLVQQVVAGLPVRVVGEDVEERDRQQLRRPLFADPEVGPARLGLDEELQRAGAHRPLRAGHGGRDQRPAEEPGEPVGRHLPAVQGTGREVPQRRLALGRLIHRERVVGLRSRRRQARQEGVVARVGQQAEQLHAGRAEEDRLRVLEAQLPVRRWAGSHWRQGRGGRSGRSEARSSCRSAGRRPAPARPGWRNPGPARG